MSPDKVRSRKRIAAAALLLAWALALLATGPSASSPPTNHNSIASDATDETIRSRELAAVDANFYKNAYIEHPDSNVYKYAYVFVTYHKAGHVLSHHLAKYLQKNLAFHFGHKLIRGDPVLPRKDFDGETKCTKLALRPGTVTVVDAPEFHCSTDELRRMFMSNPPPHVRPKYGVKVVHLVRNPFKMAASNYRYHSLDPAPEPFVHDPKINPCESLDAKIGHGHDDVEADLVSQKLENARVGEMVSVMTRKDFDNIVRDCRSLWRTRPGLTDGTYFDHLRALDPKEGLRMATADKFVHFALMANDLVMFDRVERQVHARNLAHPGKKNDFDLFTTLLDNWIERPEEAMYDFLDFVFGNHMPENRKRAQAALHEKEYVAKTLHSEHVTSGGKYSDAEELEKSLQGDPVFGGPMMRMEVLLGSRLLKEKGARRVGRGVAK